jgi:RimJ/RimL family protein N-acetyltransferase
MTLALRAAEASDCRLFYDFVNRPDSLANKRVTRQPIPWEEHKAWFAARLADAGCLMWVIVMDGDPIGQVRLTSGPEGWEIDIYVAEQQRREGVAQTAIARAVELLHGNHAHAKVIARVLPQNQASCRLFECAGFRRARQDVDHFVYTV